MPFNEFEKFEQMKKYSFILFLFIGNLIFSQIGYNDLIDKDILDSMKIENLEKVNTKNLEFSPMFYDLGIVYVSSRPKAKRRFDTNIDEAFFTLRYCEKDSTGKFTTDDLFSYDLKLKNHFGPCAFSQDENTMFLSRNKKYVRKHGDNEAVNTFGIYIYKYKDGYWILDSEFPLNSDTYNVFHPTWDEANQKLYFASDMPGGYGKTDIYSIKYVNGKWIELMNLGASVNTDQKEAFPFIYDSKYLFFASDDTGGKGGFDLYFAGKEGDKFSSKVNLGDKFNTEYDDFGFILSPDALEGYFTSNKIGGKGKDDIYRFETEKSVFRVFNSHFTVHVSEKNTGKNIEAAKIIFSKYKLIAKESPKIAKIKGIEKEIIYTIDPNSIVESTPLYTDKTGKNNVKLAAGSYIVKVMKDGFLPYSSLINTESDSRLLDIKLEPVVKDRFEFVFLDSETRMPIDGIKIDMEGGDAFDIIKKEGSKYVLTLLRGERLKLIAGSADYKKKDILIEYGSTPKSFDILMDKVQKYVDYLPTAKGEVMVLKDILYKYNSSNLTRKAKKELDKLVAHLKSHKDLKIELSSYTDSRGKKDYNQKLSERRSKSVKKYLLSKGISSNRIKAIGYGETKLKNHCSDGVKCSDEEHAINRRTEVKVL